MKMSRNGFFCILLPLLFLTLFVLFFGCTKSLEPLSIVSGPENEALEPFIEEFEKKHKTSIELHYKGPVEIMMGLQDGTLDYDAVWPANSIWIDMGDIQRKVKHTSSIMTSPVVFGIRKSKARELGFTGSTVMVRDILAAVRSEKFTFIMASATQTSSGASAYIGFLYALLEKNSVLTSEDLKSEELQRNITDLLGGVRRSSGSSGWLKDLFMESNYEAMVNFEALIIETNQVLLSRGSEPLSIIYPKDGIVIADFPLGYLDRGNGAKEETFLELQKYLLSNSVQEKITETGRRTGAGGVPEDVNTGVFNPDWGVDTERILSPVKMPEVEVIEEAMNLYQTDFRKPSLTVFCLDFSGSMRESGGITDLKEAMRMLLYQEEAKRYMIQAGRDDITIILPFSINIFDMWRARGDNQEELDQLYRMIETLEPTGATDIYTPVITALDILSNVDTLSHYIPAIILMTDGSSNRGRTFTHLQRAWESYNKDVPVLSIIFGDADEYQLKQISNLTRGRVFDGKHDLVETFRQAKGYN